MGAAPCPDWGAAAAVLGRAAICERVHLARSHRGGQDVCSRFFNRAGQSVLFPGSERLIAVDIETLKSIPTVIVVAAGPKKVAPIIAAARAKSFNQLVTDPAPLRTSSLGRKPRFVSTSGRPDSHRR
jgi:DNA-binding transcriptional regulator LsrR (DeoR family)